MKLDPQTEDYNADLYKEYMFGSAEVVGLMCLQVFANGANDKYQELKPYGIKLQSTLQKINFLRHRKGDYLVLGRTYFPNIDIAVFDNTVKCQIEKEIEAEFKEALIGIKKLPSSSMFGVYLAYKYYLSLFQKIKRKSSHEILSERVRVPN